VSARRGLARAARTLVACAAIAVAVAAFGVEAVRRTPPAAASAPTPPVDSEGWRHALQPRAFRFPRDHAAHPDHRIEWWYYTGHLDAPGRAFGYQLTFFRIGVSRARERDRSAWAPHTAMFAHFALTDVTRGRYRFAERIQRAALGLAGADTAAYRVWVDDWRGELMPDGRTHRLRANDGGMSVALDLVPRKPPVVHGRDGLSRKSSAPGAASHYVSLTRLDTRGVVRLGGESFSVRGLSWMDHEFSSSTLGAGQVGWDWFSIQLDDGAELMLYRMRLRDGGADPASSGTWIDRDGRAAHLVAGDFTIVETARWTSPRTGGVYPHGWTVRVPSRDLEVTIAPAVRDQEIVGRATGGVVYWEGSVRVTGTRGGRPARGRGYVELTGYAGAPPGP
jgi:predicted secreted hydrolase